MNKRNYVSALPNAERSPLAKRTAGFVRYYAAEEISDVTCRYAGLPTSVRRLGFAAMPDASEPGLFSEKRKINRMKLGFECEDCNEAIWPAAPPSEVRWLRNRRHVVREVAQHLHSGLDSWMTEGLAFLDEHSDHSMVYSEKS